MARALTGAVAVVKIANIAKRISLSAAASADNSPKIPKRISSSAAGAQESVERISPSPRGEGGERFFKMAPVRPSHIAFAQL
jgi:hypothetical protein